MTPTISIDFETYFSKTCSVRHLGAYAYTRHPEFYAFLIAIYDGTERFVCEPSEFNWDALSGANLLSHNTGFDRQVFEAGVEKGLHPNIKYNSWQCTAAMSAALCNRRSLRDAMMFLFNEEISKDARGNMEGLHWSDVRGTQQGKEFLEYAGADAVNCWRIWDKYKGYWSDFEQQLSLMTLDQGIYGVQIDAFKLDAYLDGARKLMFKIQSRLPWVEQGEKPTGTKAIATACRAAGIPCPPVKSHEGGEEAYEAWFKQFAPKYEWIASVAEYRSMNKFLGTLETIKERMRPDATMPFGLKYYGSHTGRWSGDAGLNMQNLKRDPILVDHDWQIRSAKKDVNEYWDLNDKGPVPSWLGTTNWGIVENGEPLPPIFEHAYDIRSLFTARPGKKLILCDLAQIEPRVLAHVAGQQKLLQAMRDGYGVYEAAAIATGKYKGEKGGFKKLKALYQAQKAMTLALGYGCGWERYIEAAMTLAQYDVCQHDEIHPETGQPIYGSAARHQVQQFREGNPEIPKLWAKLDSDFRACEGRDFVLPLPSGRCLMYRAIAKRKKKKVREIIDPNTGLVIERKIEDRWSYSAEIDGRRYELYGGAICENLVQGIARDVFAYHLLKLKEAGFRILWTIHDEAVIEADLDTPKELVSDIMSITPEWLTGCPISAEAKESNCYLK